MRNRAIMCSREGCTEAEADWIAGIDAPSPEELADIRTGRMDPEWTSPEESRGLAWRLIVGGVGVALVIATGIVGVDAVRGVRAAIASPTPTVCGGTTVECAARAEVGQ